MALTLTDVLTPASSDEWLAKLLTFGSALSLKTTAWQPGGITRTILAIVSRALAAGDQIVSIANAGGLLKFASAVTPEGGPGWLDLLAENAFDVTRNAASRGTSTVTLTNTGGAHGPFPAGTYHLRAASGHTYSNASALTIAASGATVCTIVCDQFGVTDGAASAMTPITSFSGVTSSTLATDAIGAPVESNASVVSRCQLKLGSLGPKLGNQSAYAYFAVTQSEPGYPLPTTPITRAKVTADAASGAVYVVIANASGAPAGADVTAMQTYLDGICTPDGETMVVSAASNKAITATLTAYVPAQYTTQVIADARAAWLAYLAALQIGGETDEDGTVGVSSHGLQNAIARALPYLRAQKLNLMGAGDVSYALTSSQVATAADTDLTVTAVAVS